MAKTRLSRPLARLAIVGFVLAVAFAVGNYLLPTITKSKAINGAFDAVGLVVLGIVAVLFFRELLRWSRSEMEHDIRHEQKDL